MFAELSNLSTKKLKIQKEHNHYEQEDRQTDVAGRRSISPYCDLRVSEQQSHVTDKGSLINREDS